ncbi:MAG: FAD-dependent oxidoreductase [Chitinispirillaceae bacterium]|nr:FAD-dependent oxidoreductase [Chitinispirillaceae bacterium]
MNIVIIGNGVAGVTAAETVRAEDPSAEITIITTERELFYSRPRLIEVLAGKSTFEQIIIHKAEWYEKNRINLLAGTTVSTIDPAAKKISDENGRFYSYDKLVIASGASAFVPPVSGADSEGVFTVRTAGDARTISDTARRSRKAVVIGGGLLGIETASSLATHGVSMTLVEVFDRMLPRQLDLEGSIMLQRLLERKGLSFMTGKQTERIIRKNNRLEVALSDGTVLDSDFAVFSAGIRPNISFLGDTAIERKRGIVVDDFMRTSLPDVYACGDVAEHRGVVYGLWQPSREQGIVCGSHLLGKHREYAGSVPSTRLKVAGIDVASLGEICGGENVLAEKAADEQAGIYKKLFVCDNILKGAILIGDVREAPALQKRIKDDARRSG